MKKTYMAPVVEEHKIALTGILCVSGVLDTEHSITDENEVGAPEFNIFE